MLSWCSIEARFDQEGLPDYWGIETILYELLLFLDHCQNQEGLPDYWGIETCSSPWSVLWQRSRIRKDYPTTGVLKPE